jgi:integrase
MTDQPTTKMRDGLVQRGATWSYVVRTRDPNTGKMKAVWYGGFRTRGDARTARDDARSAANKGTAVAASRITVRQYLEQWLEGIDVRPTTAVSYRLHVERYIVPRLGAERLQHLTPAMVKGLYAALQKTGRESKRKLKEGEKAPDPTGLSLTTVRRVRATLHKALADAVDEKMLQYNPADAVRLPKVEQDADGADGAGEMQVWTREELDQFLAHVATDRLFPMWRLAAWTGMRRGEVAGLIWRDVDLEGGTITVQRARVRVASADVREGPPKTKTGRRQVELDKATLAALEAWQTRQQAERDRWPGVWPEHDLIFTLEDGSALHPDYLSRAFRAHAKQAKLPTIRLHDLRHTHATLMIAAGVPVKVVSQRLGHSTVAFTMQVYQHVLPGMQRDAVQRLADVQPKVAKAARHLRVVGA